MLSNTASCNNQADATGKRFPEVPSCHEPNNALLLKLNSVSKHLGLSRFEYRLIHYFGFRGFERFRATRDKYQLVVWNQVMPELLLNLELVKTSVIAFTGILLLREYGTNRVVHTFSNLLFTGDESGSLSSLYEFSVANFDKQVARINSMMPRINEGRINQEEAVEIMVSSRFMLKYIGGHPQKIMPLIDFNRRGHDFLSLIRGVMDTEHLCAPVLACSTFRGFFLDNTMLDSAIPILPIYQKFLEELEELSSEEDGSETIACLRRAIATFNNQTFRVAKYNNDVPFFHIVAFLDSSFYELVYNQKLMALRLVNLYAAFLLLSDYYFDRDLNIWVDFMHWYHDFNFTTYGDWYYPWDASLYRLVVVQKHEVDGFSAYANFDPTVLELLAS